MYFLFYPIPIKRNTNFYSITHLYVISIFNEITNYNKNISIPQKLNLKYINSKSGEKNNFVQLTPITSLLDSPLCLRKGYNTYIFGSTSED